MSQAFITELNAVANRDFDGVVYENIFNSNPTTIKLKSVERLTEGGANLSRDIALVANPNVTSYVGLGPLPTSYLQEVVPSTVNWTGYNASITLPGMLIAANQGPNQVANILSAKLKLAELALLDLIGTDLFGSATDAPGLVGLQVSVDDGTNFSTYANISRTTYTNWKGGYLANGGTTRAWTFQLMNKAYQTARIGQASPKLAPTTQGIFNKMWVTSIPSQRFQDPEIAKLGFPNLMFNTAMVYVDSKVPTTVSGATNEMVFFLNLDTIQYVAFRSMNFKLIEFRDQSNQDGVIGHVRLYCQDTVTEPRLNCQLRDIDSTL